MSVQVSYRKQFAVLIMIFIIFLVIVEIVANVYDYFHPLKKCRFLSSVIKQGCIDFSKAVWYQDPILPLGRIEPNQHFATFNINNDGFRGPEIMQETSNQAYRIFVIGGSTTWGLYVSDQHTISTYLQENLNQNVKKRVEVINAGVPGYNSNDELNLIKNKIVNYNPELIIIYDGINDIWLPYNKTADHELYLLQYTYKKYFHFYKTPQVINNIIEEQKRPIYTKFKGVNYDLDDRAELWKNNISTICEIGKQEGFKTLVFLQPFLGAGNKSLSDVELRQKEISLKKNILTNNLIQYSYFEEKLNELNHTCNGVYNIRNVFDNVTETVYFDGGHVFPQYNKILADEMLEAILELEIIS